MTASKIGRTGDLSRLRENWHYLTPVPALLWLWRAALAHPIATLPTSPYGDLPARFAPLREFGFSQLRAGRLPLWNPRVYGGMPYVGGIETALFYIPNWIHLVLPLGLALNLVLFAHLWLAAALTTYWTRRLGAERPGAALAGLTWMLSGAVFPRLYAGHLTLLCALAWAPLLFASVDGWLTEDRPGWILTGAAASGLQWLAGHPQTAFYTAIGALIFAALRFPGVKRKARAAVGLSALFALAGGLAAIQLLPAWEAARESARASAGYAFAATFSFPPENLLTLLAPHWLGGGAFPYIGRLYFWESSLFAGVSILLLAAACPGPLRRVLFGTAAALGVLALGTHTPLHRALWLFAPGFSYFRGSGKFSAQALLLLCVGGGLGFDRVVREPEARRSLARAAAILAGALALASLFTLTPSARGLLPWLARSGEVYVEPRFYSDALFAHAWSLESASSFGWAALAAGAVAAALARRSFRALWLIGAAEVLCFASAHRALAPVREPVPQELTAALDRDPGDVRFTTNWVMHPELSMIIGRDEIWGYDALPLRRWAILAAFTQGRRDLEAGPYQTFDRLTPRLALLRCRYALVETPAPHVVRLSPELPHAFLARARSVPAGTEFDALSAPDFDPAAQAVVVQGDARPSGLAPRGSASLRALSTDELELTAETDVPALLVVSDAYSSGWTARALPGSAQAIYNVIPADFALRAVPLGPGLHRLRMSYRPRYWFAGLAVTALSVAVWLLCAALLRRNVRPRG